MLSVEDGIGMLRPAVGGQRNTDQSEMRKNDVHKGMIWPWTSQRNQERRVCEYIDVLANPLVHVLQHQRATARVRTAREPHAEAGGLTDP